LRFVCCRSIRDSVISSKMHTIMSNIVVYVLPVYLGFCYFIQNAYHHVKYWCLCVAGLFGILWFHQKCIPSCQIKWFLCCWSIRDSVISSKMHTIMSNTCIEVCVLPVYSGFCDFIQNASHHVKYCSLCVAGLSGVLLFHPKCIPTCEIMSFICCFLNIGKMNIGSALFECEYVEICIEMGT
jgi:hypothetical protein